MRFLLPLLLLFVCAAAHAQVDVNDYYPFRDEYSGDEADEEPRAMLETDSSLFYRAVQAAGDLFGEATDYKFSFVAYGRRGEPYRADGLSLDGFRLSSRYAASLRALYVARCDDAATAWGISGLFGRSFTLAGPPETSRRDASVRFSGRGDPVAIRFSAAERLRGEWRLAAALLGSTGRDLHAPGLFGNALQLGVRLDANLGARHECSLLFVLPLTMRSRRAYTTREAFELTGDPMYNPSWGYQSGRVRSARIRREAAPLLLLAWRFDLSAATSLHATLACDGGVVRRSALAWYGVSSPLPDHYALMPGAVSDGGALEERWRLRDPRYTQIDWDRLHAANRSASGGSAFYAVEDRAERFFNLRLRVAGETRIDDRLTLRYGVEAERLRSRHYKQLRDLLGGGFLADRDPYLYRYGTCDDRNDLRHPDRTVREGDRFGYDYDLCGREISVGAALEYRVDRVRLQCAARIGECALYRRGRFEKAIFPGEGSLGRSRTMRFAPFRARVAVGYSFSARDYLEAVFDASSERPDGDDLLLNPEYNNRCIDRPATGKRYAAEAGYVRTGRSVRLRVSLFAVRTADGVDVCRYYDDPAGAFCDMVVSGVGTLRYGAEAAAVVRIARRWELTLAGSLGRYRYANDPRVTIYVDRDNTLVCDGAVSRMGACRLGGVPQAAGCCGLNYFGPRGWGVRLEGAWAGSRYVDPAPSRRMERTAVQLAESPEAFDLFVSQERLPDAFACDATLFKSFYLRTARLTLMLGVRNLLGDRGIVFGGYESPRVRRFRSGDFRVYRPMESRYLYAYPRTFHAAVFFKF